MKIFTIGHSTHSREKFVRMLNAYKIQTLIDVRSYPGSRYMPQYNKENLQFWLSEVGIIYQHLPQLGGRKRHINDINYLLVEGWTHLAFRNYAAYTLTEDFDVGLGVLINIATNSITCIMCAESLPWKCHRLIISDNLTFKDIDVIHIINEKKIILHEINKYGATSKLQNSKVIYPKINFKNNS